MKGKAFGIMVAVLVAFGAQAQTSTGSAATGSSRSGDVAPQQTPAYRSMPSKPSGPSGPSASGSSVAESSAPMGSGIDSTTVGGSGSAGLAAMGGVSSATNEMGAGAMTDCPLGTSRKMGLCVPHGQTHKKVP